MTLLNLPNVVNQLGVSFSSVIARQNLLSFSLNQLKLLKDTSRKLLKIDIFDSNYPNNQILLSFLKNGSRVLNESISLRNNFPQISNHLPSIHIPNDTRDGLINRNPLKGLIPTLLTNTDNKDIDKLELVLNDTLISFINILGNSGQFINNMDFITTIFQEIKLNSKNYSGLVCIAGIINKCNLYKHEAFENAVKSIFSTLTSNIKILRSLNDLDTTLLLFHKISIMYMTPSNNAGNDINCSKHKDDQNERELPTLICISVDKVFQIWNINHENLTNGRSSSKRVFTKSLNNLTQSLFLINNFNEKIFLKLPVDILLKIKEIITNTSSENVNVEVEQKGFEPTSRGKSLAEIKNSSDLHSNVKNVLNTLVSQDKRYNLTNQDKTYKRLFSEVRVGSSLYFIDLLLT